MADDIDRAKDMLAKRMAELDARFKGRDGPKQAYFDLVGGGRAIYEVWAIGGIKPQGSPQIICDTAIEAAESWVAMSRIFDDPNLVGILYWRRRVQIEYGETREQFRSDPNGEWGPFVTTLKGWKVTGRFVIASGEPDLYPADEKEHPDDYEGWAETRKKYLAGLPAHLKEAAHHG